MRPNLFPCLIGFLCSVVLTQGQTKTIHVNLYANNDPYNNTAWNDWNVMSSLNKSGNTYSDGSSTTVSFILSVQTDYRDNGATYTGFTMCPDKVGRYTSFYDNTRTLTISGLDNNKRYDISLYASRINTAYSTVFTIGTSTVTVPVNNNKSITATFVDMAPASGSIVITISNASGSAYNYLNGFTVVEKTVSGGGDPPYTQPGGDSYIIHPGLDGYKVIDDAAHIYQPGDTLYLSGYFKSMAFYNLVGAPNNYIVVTNRPGETLIIGDSLWSGGAWAQGLIFRHCRFVEVVGSAKENFKITGSKSTLPDGNGVPVRTAYITFGMSELCSDFACHNLTIRNGGAGIFAKTEVSATDAQTWHPHNKLSNWDFFNIDITNTFNEAMYIGHTAAYWNISTNSPLYPQPGDPVPDSTIYKRPVKLGTVKIHDVNIYDIGNDAIQTAAIDTLKVYNNVITNWATKQSFSDNGGILIGGRVKEFHVHDNIIHDGWGEFMQIYAEGGGQSLVENNLMHHNNLDGVSMRGTDNLIVTLTNNTVAYAGNSTVRINGYFGATGQNIISKNILAQPRNGYTGELFPKDYIYLENGGSATEPASPNDNKKFATAAAANWDENNYYQPNAGSSAVGYGYIRELSNLFFVYAMHAIR